MISNKEEVLAQCLETIENGLPIEDCLEQNPQYREELLEMLDIIQSIQTEASRVVVQAQFRRTAQSRLMSRLTERRVTFWDRLRHIWQSFQPLQTKKVSLAWTFLLAFAVIFFTSSGVVYASGSALPGDSLYTVKGFVEETLLFISNDQGDLNLRVQFAERRLKEMETLASLDRVLDLETAVDGYITQVEAISLMVEEASIGETELENLNNINVIQGGRLAVLLDKVPDQVQEQMKVAIEANEKVGPGKSGNIGKPEETGNPENTASVKITRKPKNTDKPEHTAKPEDTATQEDTAKPENTATQEETPPVEETSTEEITETPPGNGLGPPVEPGPPEILPNEDKDKDKDKDKEKDKETDVN